MRESQFEDFKADVKTGLSESLLSELYDLPLAGTRRAIKYVNRSWLECFITGLVQFFRKIVFEIQMKIRMFRIRQLLSEVKNYGRKCSKNNDK